MDIDAKFATTKNDTGTCTWGCMCKRDMKAKTLCFKGFSWGGCGFANRFMILTYLCPTI